MHIFEIHWLVKKIRGIIEKTFLKIELVGRDWENTKNTKARGHEWGERNNEMLG